MQTETTNPQTSHSTGPRTASGKATSSRNSLSHGLTATSISAFPPEVQAEFAAYRESLRNEVRPSGENEATYFERYAFAQFLTLKSQSLEGSLVAQLLFDETNEALLNRLKTITRYTRTLERSADRARTVLNELIANRHLIFIAQDIITHAENSDVTVPAALPIHKILRAKDYKTNWDDSTIAIIHCEKQRQWSASQNENGAE